MPHEPLTTKEFLVIELLAGRSDVLGLDIVARSGGQLDGGSVYVFLSRLEERGLVERRPEDRSPDALGIPRPLYSLTTLGEETFLDYTAVRDH